MKSGKQISCPAPHAGSGEQEPDRRPAGGDLQLEADGPAVGLADPENGPDRLSRHLFGPVAGQSSDIVLHCFRCHREDYHFLGLKPFWYWNFLVGFTFGLVYITGPFRCRCCGAWRLMRSDLFSPRFWLESLHSSPYRSEADPGRRPARPGQRG